MHGHVAHEDANAGADERVLPAAMAARADVALDLPRRRGQLEEDLPEQRARAPRDVEAVGEERAVAGVRLLLGADPAHGQQHVVGVAGEQVAAARAAVREQAVARRVPPLDLGAVVGVRADHQRPALLLDPAERGDVLVRAEQDARLARAGLRGEVGLPLDHAVRALGHPARHLRRVAVAHRPLEHRLRQPVDLEEDDPRGVGGDLLARPAGEPLRHPQRVLVVVVRARRRSRARS